MQEEKKTDAHVKPYMLPQEGSKPKPASDCGPHLQAQPRVDVTDYGGFRLVQRVDLWRTQNIPYSDRQAL